MCKLGGRAGGGGGGGRGGSGRKYTTKNKNPTQRCGGKTRFCFKRLSLEPIGLHIPSAIDFRDAEGSRLPLNL